MKTRPRRESRLRRPLLRAWLRAVLAALALASAGPAGAADGVEFVKLAFYADTVAGDAPGWDSPRLGSRFAQPRARFVSTLINLRNLRWRERGQDVRLDVRYYAADGDLLGAPRIDYHLPADWESADLWTGWAYADAERWPPGDYRVELWLDGGGKIGGGKFTITAAGGAPAGARARVALDRMGFFEAGVDGRDDPPASWQDSRLRDRFDRRDARYIYTLVSLKNLAWRSDDQDVVIHLRYYRDDGSLVGDPVIEYRVPRDWEYAELWNGWGWPDAGNWESGSYRVELWLDDRRLLGGRGFRLD